MVRPQDSVVKVFEMVGLRKLLSVHANLPLALDDLVADYLRVAATIG